MKEIVKELRLKNNGIMCNFDNAYECISLLHGIQSQYDLYAYIALINRVKKFNWEEIVLNENIVKSWGQRVTLHINTKENMFINRAVFTLRDNWIKKKVKKLGGSIEEIVKQISYATYDNEYFTKAEIQNKIKNSGKAQMMQWGGVLAQASIEGYIFEVIDNDGDRKYSKIDKGFLNTKIDYEKAIRNLIEKYIIAFGPVSEDDFAHWSGLRKKDFIKYWDLYKKKFECISVDNILYYYRENNKYNKKNKIILLGKFDPLLLAYQDKTWLIEQEYLHKVWKKAGQVEGVLLVDNYFAGTWHCNQKNNKLCYYLKCIYKIDVNTIELIENRMKQFSKMLMKKHGEITIESY